MLTLTSEAEVSQRLYRGKAMPGKGTLFIKISIIRRQIGVLVMQAMLIINYLHSKTTFSCSLQFHLFNLKKQSLRLSFTSAEEHDY